MLKIIIADDERAIRESISTCIDWKELDLDLVGVYANGVDTYDAVLNESPDIVLTDIKMPGMDGLELIERVSRTDPDTQFILLSGYGEFEFAQRAMRYGVRHYLLKPCNEEKLKDSLKETIQECCRRRAIHRLSEQQKKISNSLQQSMFMNILTEASIQTEHDNSALYMPWYKHLDFTHTKYRMIRINGVSEGILAELHNRLQAYHKANAPSLPLHGLYVKDMLLLFTQDYHLDESKVREGARIIHESGCDGNPVMEVFPNLTLLLDHVLQVSRQSGAIYFVADKLFVPLFNYRNTMDIVKRCCLSICDLAENDSATASQRRQMHMDILFSQLQTIDNPDFFIQLATNILFTFSDHDLCCSLVEATEIMLEIKKYSSIEEMKNYFLPWLSKALDNIQDNSRLEGKLIQEIKDYIHENLSNPDLTLKMIAENYLFMNVDYLSKRFFKETGVKFSMYLREVRIQKAKELIASDDFSKLQNIAESVGLGNNPQYFSQVFKKQTGMTPSAYSKKMHGRE